MSSASLSAAGTEAQAERDLRARGYDQRVRVIIAEKPSAARAIRSAIRGDWIEESGAFRQGDDWISWSLGHLFELAPPERYNPEWKRWDASQLPMIPAGELLLSARRGSGLRERRDQLKNLLRDPKLEEVVNACDAGREGELIFDRLLVWAGCVAPRSRMWFSALTGDAIRSAWEERGPERSSLLAAARARARADWIVGMNGTRAVSLLLRDRITSSDAKRALSVGRVQTPTLALLVSRELQRAEFSAEERFSLSARLSQGESEISAFHSDSPLKSETLASEIASDCDGARAVIKSWDIDRLEEPPPPMFDLGDLQARASAELRWSAKRTLDSAQALYERGLISYPRSDSRELPRSISDSLVKTLKLAAGRASALAGSGGEWGDAAQQLEARGGLDERALSSDHHAIIPISTEIDQAAPSDRPLLGMIWRRSLQALSAPVEWERGRAVIEISDHHHEFISEDRGALKLGWRSLDHDPPQLGGIQTALTDEPLTAERVSLRKTKTRPPGNHTDGSLLSAMRSAGSGLDDPEARRAMRENGLGTAATRAQIIERLISVGYVRRDGVALRPSELGISLINLLRGGDEGLSVLTSPELTGEWEKRLREIERGELDPGEFDRASDQLTREIVSGSRALKSGSKPILPTDSIGPCPCCGEPLRESPKGFSCWRPGEPGCGLTIYKRVAKKRLTKAVIRELIERGESADQLHGFKSKAGREFSARLRVNKKERKVEMLFD